MFLTLFQFILILLFVFAISLWNKSCSLQGFICAVPIYCHDNKLHEINKTIEWSLPWYLALLAFDDFDIMLRLLFYWCLKTPRKWDNRRQAWKVKSTSRHQTASTTISPTKKPSLLANQLLANQVWENKRF